jgi:hypothetical protein
LEELKEKYRQAIPKSVFSPELIIFNEEMNQILDDKDITVNGKKLDSFTKIYYELPEYAGLDAFLNENTRDDSLVRQVTVCCIS